MYPSMEQYIVNGRQQLVIQSVTTLCNSSDQRCLKTRSITMWVELSIQKLWVDAEEFSFSEHNFFNPSTFCI